MALCTEVLFIYSPIHSVFFGEAWNIIVYLEVMGL